VRPRPSPTGLRATILLVGLIALVLFASSGCRAGPGQSAQPTTPARLVEIVVPLGTADRVARGETVTVMPARLELRVGDTLRIHNQDVVDQPVGPFIVKAGQVQELRYGAPGRYQGYCLLAEGETYEIVVTE
jgi:hypothetical protein